jgi:hypothetical protein
MNNTATPKLGESFFDNTKLSSYKDCPRRYFLRHCLNWRGEGIALPLAFGLSWHAGMDIVWTHAKNISQEELVEGAMAAFYETWVEQGLDADLDLDQIQTYTPRTPNVAREMYHHYISDRWDVLSNCELIMAEQPFAVPMPGMDKTWYVGRLDKVIEYNGSKIVIEHKTTSIYKKDGGFQSSYIEGWYSDSQVKGYQFGAGLYYPGLHQIWVDAALVHKTVHDAFRFIPVQHNFEMLKEWVDDAHAWIDDVQRDEHKFKAAGDRLTPGCFKKNENACFGKFGQCSYLDVCRTTADPSVLTEPPAGFVVEKWEPFETLGLDKLLNKE